VTVEVVVSAVANPNPGTKKKNYDILYIYNGIIVRIAETYITE